MHDYVTRLTRIPISGLTPCAFAQTRASNRAIHEVRSFSAWSYAIYLTNYRSGRSMMRTQTSRDSACSFLTTASLLDPILFCDIF